MFNKLDAAFLAVAFISTINPGNSALSINTEDVGRQDPDSSPRSSKPLYSEVKMKLRATETLY